MCFPVLRHRIFTNFNADAEGIDVNDVIAKIIQMVPESAHGDPVAAKTKPTCHANRQTKQRKHHTNSIRHSKLPNGIPNRYAATKEKIISQLF
jgi:hypothetical protein